MSMEGDARETSDVAPVTGTLATVIQTDRDGTQLCQLFGTNTTVS